MHCRSILLTGGIGTFTPRPLAAAGSFHGRGVDYFVRTLADYANEDVVIVGGGDSAFDWAQALESIARSVTLVHRRQVFRAHRATVESVRSAGVPIITNAEISKIRGVGNIEGVEVFDVVTKESKNIPCSRVVAALGFTANLGPLKEWGVDIKANRSVTVDSAMRTNYPGVFAAGDISEYDGKVPLIAVGFGEVATAVNNAAVYINPSNSLFPGHSTDAEPVAAESA